MNSLLSSTYTAERLKLVLDRTRLGMWDWAPQTNDVVFDSNWAKMLGLRLEDLTMTLDDWSSRVHPDDMDSCMADIQAHIEGKTEFYQNLHRMKHKNGHWVFILDRGRVVERDAEGNALRFTGTHADMTDLKNAEFEALLATKSKERFFLNMSHELRAPLHAMLGILEQVQKTSLSSEVHKQLDIVETSGQHLLNLVNNLLDASKLKNSSLTLQTSVFDLLELVRNGYNLFASRIQDKGLTFDIVNNLKADQCLIETDKSRLYQVIINLLSNAMKFTTSGKVSLLISNGDEGGISLEVVDTGEGIENMSAIFQPFFSKDVSEKYDELSSTGLGLSVAKEIIHALGFDLSVQSTVCKGSTFSINIPHTAVRTQTALNLSESKLLSDNAKPLTMKSWSGKSVLEIDDSQINLIVIQAMLSSSPLDMIVANSVDEALVILEEQPVDIVISDLHMPHKGGLELSKQMRLNKKTRSRPLIIASADIRQEAWPKCEDAGVTDYLEKPFNENKLLNLIEVYLTP